MVPGVVVLLQLPVVASQLTLELIVLVLEGDPDLAGFLFILRRRDIKLGATLLGSEVSSVDTPGLDCLYHRHSLAPGIKWIQLYRGGGEEEGEIGQRKREFTFCQCCLVSGEDC